MYIALIADKSEKEVLEKDAMVYKCLQTIAEYALKSSLLPHLRKIDNS